MQVLRLGLQVNIVCLVHLHIFDGSIVTLVYERIDEKPHYLVSR